MMEKMDSEMICAAILTGAFICNQRSALTSGVVDTTIREKFPEYLQLVRETAAKSPSASAEGEK